MIRKYKHKALRQAQESADGKTIICDFLNGLTGARKQKAFSTKHVTFDGIDRWINGEMIQNTMPELTPADRELFLTGMDDDEWNAL